MAVAREKSREINRPEWTDRRKQDGLGPLDVQNSCINLHQLLLPEILASVLHMQQFGSMHGCTGPSMHWMILTDWPNHVHPKTPGRKFPHLTQLASLSKDVQAGNHCRAGRVSTTGPGVTF
ncbi:MAG: hypothetical protein OXB95_00505, partial [Rhodobacteraceae bacterium]|nr:hypothetical protein [Paracoccaceae bacterium]